jgi:hypothetical protein
MSKQTLGVLTLGMVGLALGVAIYALVRISLLWSLIYLVGFVVGGYFVITRYCAKCACKECCPHVVTGWLARKIDRQPGAYTRSELTGMIVSLLVMLIPPVIWLIGQPLLLAIFLGLVAIAAAMIWAWLCKTCANLYCPIRFARLKSNVRSRT